MSNYSYNENSREISGFGGEYEDACRKMVIAGMQWWDEHPEADVRFQEYENITGITVNESEDCKKLQHHMNESAGFGVTGAMMQYCLNHLMFAHKNGWEAYLEKLGTEKEEA